MTNRRTSGAKLQLPSVHLLLLHESIYLCFMIREDGHAQWVDNAFEIGGRGLFEINATDFTWRILEKPWKSQWRQLVIRSKFKLRASWTLSSVCSIAVIEFVRNFCYFTLALLVQKTRSELFTCKWKYVYFKAVSRLMPSVRHWESQTCGLLFKFYLLDIANIFICREHLYINAICQTLWGYYEWKYVHSEAVCELKSCVRRTVSDVSLRIFNFIFQITSAFYRWKYAHVETICLLRTFIRI
jgi:hypothetical protein